VLIGEIGGTEEQDAADFISAARPDIPIVALIVGRHAPAERRMGHSGALTLNGANSAKAKISALERAGVIVAPSPHLVGDTMRLALAAVAVPQAVVA
jgi:succinyl-CoA synthetase alpha subunit